MLGYVISDGGHEAWVFYKWVHSAIDEVVNQHDFHSIFQYEPAAQPSSWPSVTMITWDELNVEVRCLPLIRAWKLHIQCTKMFDLVLSPDLNLSDSEGLLMEFLPSATELPLQPFPTEHYCSVYHLMAFCLMQILENAMAIPDRLEPIPQVSPFFCAVYRHLHMVGADPEAGAFKF